jgi:uracil-DNA glycosylase
MLLATQIWRCLTVQLFSVASCAKTGLFNPYNSVDPTLDRNNADNIRRENLRNYVNCFVHSPKFFLVGEAPGWRGCRLSGIPFTSEAQLVNGTVPFAGQQSSHAAQPYAENSANYFWELLASLHPNFFIWNAVPLHPHKVRCSDENRKPTTKERKKFEQVTDGLIAILKPHQIIAIGRVAESALHKHKQVYVRHPSFGGATEFRDAMQSLKRNNRA